MPTARTSSLHARGLRWMAGLHGAIYFVSGAWPLVDITSFQLVTGPKTDLWLVRTVGLLLMLDGAVLLGCWWRHYVPGVLVALACLHAAGLSAIDVVYVSVNRIAPIYLADAVLELSLIAAWAWVWHRRSPAAELP